LWITRTISPPTRASAEITPTAITPSASTAPDGLQIVKQVLDAGATIKVLDFPSLDLTTPEGRGFLAMFSAMAERERIRIVARTREGRRIAMTNGVKMGPPFKLTEHQRKLAAKRIATGESARQIARDFNVSHNTIARLR
jgi:DNA invertase Pin-like site-specific DNA recombinase